MSENDHKKRTDAYNTLYFLWIGLILIESSIINYQSNSSYVAKMWFVDWNLQFEIFCCLRQNNFECKWKYFTCSLCCDKPLLKNSDLVYSKLWHKLAKPSLNIPNNDIRPFE